MARAPLEKGGILTFVYEGTNRRNQKVKGELNAKNMAFAKAVLRKQGIDVQKIYKKTAYPWDNLSRGSVKPMDVAIFVRQIATMMKAGVPLVQSFEIVAEGLENPAMRDVVLKIKTDVEGGDTFASALRKQPKHFDELFCSLVASGEQSGSLETMLDRIATYKEKSEMLKQKIKKAMWYPAAVMIVAFIVTIILLLKVVPVFAELFSSFGAELPAFTQFVLGLSNWMQHNWHFFFGGLIALVFGLRWIYKSNPKVQDGVDRYILKAPIFGNIIHKSIVARFSRTLSTTFSAGVPLIDALDSSAGAAGNAVFRDAIRVIKDEVSTGQQLNFSMKNTQLFPSMAIQMTAIGEETGRIDEMLDKVATFYESEVDAAVDGLTSLLEPLIMVVLGVLVGGLVIAMYLPIFQMGQVVG